MRAVALVDFETGPALRELDRPAPGPNDVLVRVAASSVNGFDAAVAAGMLKGTMEYDFPVTLGRDVAGVVEEVGSDVGEFSAGDEVFGFVGKPSLSQGTWAEYALLEDQLVLAPKPRNLGFGDAAALALAGVTALWGVDLLEPQQGDTVLIVGAGGGVGSLAVQLAAQRGASVIATARAGDEARLRGLGASQTIDFTSEDVADSVRARGPEGVQCLLDLATFMPDAFAALAALVAPGGRAATSLGAADVESLAAREVTATNLQGPGDRTREYLERVGELADKSELKIEIERVYPLERATEALEAFGGGKRGKLAISVD